MKFCQVIEYNKKIFFSQNYRENETERLAPTFFSFFKKYLFEVKAEGPQLNFNIFR